MNAKALQRLAQCDGKRRYSSWSGAEQVLTRVLRRFRARGLHVYHCQFCHGFHLGTSLAGEIARAVK